MGLNDGWEHKVFQSNHIHSASYSYMDRTLSVKFGKEQVEYKGNVGPDLWDKFKHAQSPGQFYALVVRPNFRMEKVKVQER